MIVKIEYDKDEDAGYVYLKYPLADEECVKTVKVTENIIVDFDSESKLLGIELFHASKVLAKETLEKAVPA